MDARSNFVAVLEDLETLSGSWRNYDLLRIPGVLRLLLMDQRSLMDQVNREFRMKLRFRVGHFMDPPTDESGRPLESELMFGTVGDSFDPEFLGDVVPKVPLDFEPTTVDRDRFLTLKLMVVEGEFVSVGELIRHLAYVHGLTHGGHPKEPKDEALLGWRRVLTLGDSPAGLREIRAVGRVAHRGLVPLREAVLKRYG